MRLWLGQAVVASTMAMAMMLSLAGRAETSAMLEAGTVGVETLQPEMLVGKPYALHMHHLHTGETLDITYRIGNSYLPEALAKLNYFLRDHRTMDMAEYDPREFDLLHSVMAKLGRANGIIEIVCGYRTPESNHFLRTRAAVTGVAEHSQHMEGRAIDIKVPGVKTATLRNAGLSMEAGGVGYYPTSAFVHLDVGPVRDWQYGGSARRRGVRVKTTAVHHRVHRRRA